MPRTLIAMSGGVDSSVAALRLRRVAAPGDVIGVTLHLWDYPDEGEVKGRCCAPEDVHDARRVCDALGIPYYAFDRRELFQSRVVEPFVEAYLSGTTPSPCVRCNRTIKIPELLSIATSLGAERVATGHYAGIVECDGMLHIRRARDEKKDQSYFLHTLSPETLGRLVFPLAEATKVEVRSEAKQLGLPGADKGESQELCFVPTGRYDEFIEARASSRVQRGVIRDRDGKVMGEHEGIHRFTVGQRRNLGVALGERAYVVGIDAISGEVRLGRRGDLACHGALIRDVSLHPSVRLPVECDVVVRYRGAPHRALVEAVSGGLRVSFRDDVSAVVPGQVAVLYDGDKVLGGGTIQGSTAGADARRLPLAGQGAVC